MADDQSKRDFRDRNKISASDDYEVNFFALQNNITPEQVRELIRKHGNDRATDRRREGTAGTMMTKRSDLGPPIAGWSLAISVR
ncbi:MAG: DUF3606 domain-containing protein [Mesorhizobium sp.]|uniref:DUF3606 domain-containing protein n=1 Tax=Mesorhizobium sp. TaxID=1871066 RepID=UPI00120A50B0|nr:DUF3606 domain-containing protein [Mesorhizobium sp.]TIP30214.1 MAG: DUF3606 domain-containing protein [Mesorhizobium sp.]